MDGRFWENLKGGCLAMGGDWRLVFVEGDVPCGWYGFREIGT